VIKDTRHPEHFITAVNADGTVKWRFGTGWWDTQTQSSPALGADGRIYVGAQDGYFYALNPNGTLAWRFAATRPVQQHPVVANDGTVYIGLDGVLHAFDPNGTVRWTASLGTTSLPGGPALSPDGQTIYAFGHDEAGPVATLYAFRPDGTIRWQSTNFYGYYPALSPPTVAADGTVIVLSGQVVAIGPDGVERWRYSPSASYYNSYASLSVTPAGEVVFAFGWYLGKLSATGTEMWQLDFVGGEFGNELESTYSAPLIDANGNIYLGLGTGKRWTRPWGKVLRSYSAGGSLNWQFPLGEGVYTSSPALAPDGTLYVGSMDGALYAIEGPPVTPPNAITGLVFAPGAIGGGPAQGSVSLRDPAGVGGATVTIARPPSSPATSPVTLPASVFVPQGASSTVFTVATRAVSTPTPVTVCGTYGGVTMCGVLTLMPKPASRAQAPLPTRRQGTRAAANHGGID
jgi:outer membrane protein assembly factor BamB